MADSSITISGSQRNLLYKPILQSLSAANDVYLVAVHGRYDEAHRLGRQLCEDLLFVLGDLGWRDREVDEVIRMITPPSIVRRVVRRILDGAEQEAFEGTREEIQSLEEEGRELRSACEAVLSSLPREGPSQ